MQTSAQLPACRPLNLRRQLRTASPVKAARLAPANPQGSRGRRCALRTQAVSGDIGAVIFDAFAGSPLKLGGTIGISFATYSAILYFRLQYILAAHIGNNVPPKARVVEYGIGNGRSVYYYPPDTVSIYGVDPSADSGLLLQVGGAAGQTVMAQKSELAARLAVEASSIDAVVSVKAVGRSDKLADILKEAGRVLKPGGRLIYFEEGKDGERLTSALESSPLFSEVQRDGRWASYFLSPHSIGARQRCDAAERVAVRSSSVVSMGNPAAAGAEGGKGGGGSAYQRPPKEQPKPKKGFGGKQ